MRLRLRKLKQVYRYLPTGLTIGNSLCGFTAIIHMLGALEPQADIPGLLAGSAWLIIFAMLFDMLDGWTARLLKAMSDHGMEMDSLADMVTFGVAPAVMVSVMAKSYSIAWLPQRLVWILAALYLACAALRLALYNVQARMPEKKRSGFHGLPSPGAAAAVCSLVLLYSRAEFEFAVLANLLPLYAAVLGLLMVSPIPYPHVGRWLGVRRHSQWKILAVILFFVLFSMDPPRVAALAINGYVLFGPIRALLDWTMGRAGDAAAEEPEPQEKQA